MCPSLVLLTHVDSWWGPRGIQTPNSIVIKAPFGDRPPLKQTLNTTLIADKSEGSGVVLCFLSHTLFFLKFNSLIIKDK